MKKLILSLTLLLVFLFPAYAQEVKPITEEQAIEIAIQERSGGNTLTRSDTEISAHFENGEWLVVFRPKPDDQGRVPMTGGQLIVISPEGEVIEVMYAP